MSHTVADAPNCPIFVKASLIIVIGRQPAIGIFVNAHPGAHELWPQRARRDLQDQVAPFDRAVVAASVRLLDTQNLADPARAVGDEGAAGLPRRDREGGVVLRQVLLGDIAVGRLEQCRKTHLPYPLQQLRPLLFRGVLKPDRSLATNSGQIARQTQLNYPTLNLNYPTLNRKR